MNEPKKYEMGRSDPTVTEMGDYRPHDENVVNEDETGVDKAKLFKLIGGVIGFFILLLGGAFFLAQSQASTGPKSSQLSLIATASKGNSPQLSKFSPTDAVPSLNELDIPGVANFPAATAQPSLQITRSAEAQPSAVPEVSVAALERLIEQLQTTVSDLGIEVQRLSLANKKAATNNDEMRTGLTRLSTSVNKVTAIQDSVKQDIKRQQVAEEQARQSGAANHGYTIRGVTPSVVFIGKTDDPAFLKKISVGSEVPGLGVVTAIKRDAASRQVTVMTTLGKIES
ncbi:MAG: hypothetical protein JKY60_03285 [Kordiimonadaceae bacterium]|nr:hypothetical protein [Kordiimonadaceae bacterium]